MKAFKSKFLDIVSSIVKGFFKIIEYIFSPLVNKWVGLYFIIAWFLMVICKEARVWGTDTIIFTSITALFIGLSTLITEVYIDFKKTFTEE